MSSFFSSLADKAQSAINASPLAGKIPPLSSAPRPGSPDGSNQPAANEAAAQGGQRNHALEALSYQFRSLQQQYSFTTSSVQKIITTEKGLALDFETVSRESKAQAKDLYTWGQSEPEDVKDVADRMAYLNFVHGSLSGTLSQKLDAARTPFKGLRGSESTLQPRRAARTNMEVQLSQVKNDTKRAAEIKEQLRKAEDEDSQHEKDIELLKRKALRESEQLKWVAIQEYAEKLLLLCQAATPILAQLPSIPPGPTSPYKGSQTTGAVRAALQQALDNHKLGTTQLNLPPVGANLARSDTRSFGESHATELSNIRVAGTQATPTPAPAFPVPQAQEQLAHSPPLSEQSAPINPSSLNQAPAVIPPVFATSPSSMTAAETKAPSPAIIPTVAETGLPLSAGASGPGPLKGSLHDLRDASSLAGVLPNSPPAPTGFPTPASAIQHESAEEEKKRLAALYSQTQTTSSGPSTSQTHETAEEEKRRMEREERERILRGGPQPPAQGRKSGEPEEDLPPYQEPTFQ